MQLICLSKFSLISFTILLSVSMHAALGQGMINNGATITITAGANVIIDGNALGSYTNQTFAGSDGKIDLNGNMYVEGNWINNATGNNVFINNTAATWGTVYLNGTAATSIGGTRRTEFENLYIQNANRTLLITDCEVNNRLTVDNAVLILNQNKFIIDNAVATNISSVGTGNIRSESTGAPFGEIQWNIGSATGISYVIPFGTAASDLIPFTFRPTAGITGNLIAATYPTNGANLPYPPGVTAVNNLYTGVDNSIMTVDRFWEVIVPGALTTANINFRCTPAEAAGIPNPRAQRWLQPMLTWEFPLQGAQSTQVTGTNVTGMTGINSWWTLADITSPLPVELLFFNAKCLLKNVQLNWSTASEINSSHFIIEKSKNTAEFTRVAEISGAGNCSSQRDYTYTDHTTNEGYTFYRLKQVDFDGTENIISSWEQVNPCRQTTTLSAYVMYHYNGPYLIINSAEEGEMIINITDVNGRIIHREKVMINRNRNQIELQSGLLSNGIYMVQISSTFETVNQKILIAGLH